MLPGPLPNMLAPNSTRNPRVGGSEEVVAGMVPAGSVVMEDALTDELPVDGEEGGEERGGAEVVGAGIVVTARGVGAAGAFTGPFSILLTSSIEMVMVA